MNLYDIIGDILSRLSVIKIDLSTQNNINKKVDNNLSKQKDINNKFKNDIKQLSKLTDGITYISETEMDRRLDDTENIIDIQNEMIYVIEIMEQMTIKIEKQQEEITQLKANKNEYYMF